MFVCLFVSFVRYSDDEDFEALDWLPMAPEIEDPEEPGWGQLEVRVGGVTGMWVGGGHVGAGEWGGMVKWGGII